jgi:PAS domain-containing protein
MTTQTANYVTGDPAFAVDRRGEIVLWNQAAEKTLGYPASAAMGQRCWKLLSGKDTYENQYCCECCALREIAFDRKAVNGFHLSFKTALEGFKQYSICCLIVSDVPGNRSSSKHKHPFYWAPYVLVSSKNRNNHARG